MLSTRAIGRSLAVGGLLTSLACSTEPGVVVDLQALELSTTYAPQSDTLVTITGAVRFHNPSNRSVTVLLRSPCTIIVRVYRLDEATTPAWDQARRAGGCKTFPFELLIAARDVQSVPFGPIDAAEILGDSLPVMAYRLTAFIAERGTSGNGAELPIATAVLRRL